MNTNKIRQTFLDFFAAKKHQIVSSSSIVPENDPTLLFTNAGMNQFKDVFLGKATLPYSKAASVQCCVRAGGKHNDLENVGFTARHHTFFEMLGNFSFGDYFKREAIHYAWEFLTKVLKISPEKLWVTVYKEDKESEDIWLTEIKIDSQRFSRCGAKDNFWAMGDTGPCGPCSEIFYDHGPEISGTIPGDKHAGDRYVEIWNLVFMQYNRESDGKLTSLPQPSVDTGMGLERIAAVMQGVHNNYDIDIFQYLIEKINTFVKIKNKHESSIRAIADHIRSSVFLIAEGILPSNEGRGYVLRRIIRRAIRHGNKLGINHPFFYRLTPSLVEVMGTAYPNLRAQQDFIGHVIHNEEKQFAATLEQGLKILDEEIAKLSGKVLSGNTVFKLYDTYGFPVDLTRDIAQEHGLVIDEEAFSKEMNRQRTKSQEASKFAVDYTKILHLEGTTKFLGYHQLNCDCKIINIYKDNNESDKIKEGEEGILILDQTVFYAESGGQVGDQGEIYTAAGNFQVTDTKKQGEVYIHQGYIKQGIIAKSENATAAVDSKRQAIAANHSATHLLHVALCSVLGSHVEQKGSYVDGERSRFDFSHLEALHEQQISMVEKMVNQQIRANLPVTVKKMSLEEAKTKGAVALFGEKYGDVVRMVSMGNYSKELCGGTHINATGEIGVFKIISESGIAAGVRRIEALTGEKALEYFEKLEANLKGASALLKTDKSRFIEKIQQTIEQMRRQEKQLDNLKLQLAKSKVDDFESQAFDIKGIKVIVAKIDDADMKTLRDAVDRLKSKTNNSVILLASATQEKVQLISGVSKQLSEKINAGKLIQYVAQQIGGKGGGRADMAQGGGTNIKGLDKALASVKEWIKNKIT